MARLRLSGPQGSQLVRVNAPASVLTQERAPRHNCPRPLAASCVDLDAEAWELLFYTVFK